jgi:hypothetical protein
MSMHLENIIFGILVVISVFMMLLNFRMQGEINGLRAIINSLQSRIYVNISDIDLNNKILIKHDLRLNQIEKQINKSE